MLLTALLFLMIMMMMKDELTFSVALSPKTTRTCNNKPKQ